MSDGLGFLTAVYRDGRVHIGGKSYPAGTFAVQLLNQYYKDDTAARIAVFRQSNWNVQEQLCAGYLNKTDFIKAGDSDNSANSAEAKAFFLLGHCSGEAANCRAIHGRQRCCPFRLSAAQSSNSAIRWCVPS